MDFFINGLVVVFGSSPLHVAYNTEQILVFQSSLCKWLRRDAGRVVGQEGGGRKTGREEMGGKAISNDGTSLRDDSDVSVWWSL